jgi:hypothetical protein
MSIAETIALLRAVVLSPDCAKMNLSTVKGYMGELLVKERLEAELGTGQVEHFGNQHGHDLQFTHRGKTIKVDVKTSTAKDERHWGFHYWSWALLNDTKKKDISATHFICAGLNGGLELQGLFVVATSDLSHFPRDTGQFRNNKHVLFLPQSQPPKQARGLENEIYLQSHAIFQSGKVRTATAAGQLLEACG